jgi:hypothetical protein
MTTLVIALALLAAGYLVAVIAVWPILRPARPPPAPPLHPDGAGAANPDQRTPAIHPCRLTDPQLGRRTPVTALDALLHPEPDSGDAPPTHPPTHLPAVSHNRWADQIQTLWHGYGYPITLVALTAVVLFLVIALLVSLKRRRVDRWVSTVAWIAGFGFSADSMWTVATHKAHITPAVAWAVFFVGEAFMGNSMIHAGRRYKTTTKRDEKTDTVIKAGDPGKHGRAVWIIAAAMAVIVGFASANPAEFALRASIPLGVALLWWNTLTADGTDKPASKFAWTPTRLLERAGALVPDVNDDLAAMARERRIRALVNVGQRVDSQVWPVGFHLWRLTRLARTADAAMVTEARNRLDRAIKIAALLHLNIATDSSTHTAQTKQIDDDRTAIRTEPDRPYTVEPNGQPNTSPIAEPNVRPNTAANTPIEQPPNGRPNTRPNGEANSGPNGEANVRLIDSARREPNTDPIAANLRTIKRRYKNWRTNLPSARQCAAAIGAAPSTGLSYRRRLIDELTAAAAKSSGSTDSERPA